MKLAAIYNVWDGVELLRPSIMSIRDHVDHVIVVYQDRSNFGMIDTSAGIIAFQLEQEGIVDEVVFYMPNYSQAADNETAKRQLGIQYAIDAKCTHFMCLDVDEFYDPEEFAAMKQEAYQYDATAAKIYVYFKSPSLRFLNHDTTLVPFIHRLYPFTKTGAKRYPVLADRTRRIQPIGKFNVVGGAMHHLSWVRDDIEKKIMNSTARNNINRQDIRNDYNNACEGYVVTSIYNDILIHSDFFDWKI